MSFWRTSIQYTPYHYSSLQALKPVLEDLKALSKKGHERVAIIPKDNAYTLSTAAKPKTIFGRVWEILFGKNDNVDYSNAANFAAHFFLKNQDCFKEETDLQEELLLILKLQKKFCKIETANNIFDHLATFIFTKINQESVRSRIIAEAENSANEIVAKAINDTAEIKKNAESELQKNRELFDRMKAEADRIIQLAQDEADKRMKEFDRKIVRKEEIINCIESKIKTLEQAVKKALIVFPLHQLSFTDLLRNPENLDIVLMCAEGMEVYAHSLFLARFDYTGSQKRMGYREACEQHPCKDGVRRKKIDVSEYSKEVVELMVHYCFSIQPFELTDEENISDLLSLSNMIGITQLQQQCEEKMIHMMDKEEALEFINESQYPIIHRHALSLVAQNFTEIFQNKDFLNYDLITIKSLLQSEQINNTPELQVFLMLKEWVVHEAKNDPVETTRLLMNEGLLELVRFEYFTIEEFVSVAEFLSNFNRFNESGFINNWINYLDNLCPITELGFMVERSMRNMCWKQDSSSKFSFSIDAETLERLYWRKGSISSPLFIYQNIQYQFSFKVVEQDKEKAFAIFIEASGLDENALITLRTSLELTSGLNTKEKSKISLSKLNPSEVISQGMSMETIKLHTNEEKIFSFKLSLKKSSDSDTGRRLRKLFSANNSDDESSSDSSESSDEKVDDHISFLTRWKPTISPGLSSHTTFNMPMSPSISRPSLPQSNSPSFTPLSFPTQLPRFDPPPINWSSLSSLPSSISHPSISLPKLSRLPPLDFSTIFNSRPINVSSVSSIGFTPISPIRFPQL